MHLLSPKEAQALFPLMTVDDVVGAAFLPTDGQASPSDIVQALARGARNAGVTICEDTRVTAIRVEDGRVRGVETAEGVIQCDKLVIACGQWSREMGRLAGVNIPLVSVQHHYAITEPIEGVTQTRRPFAIGPPHLLQGRGRGLIVGGYEPNPVAWAENGIPEGFHYTLLDPDWDHFAPVMELALPRVPALQHTGSSSS